MTVRQLEPDDRRAVRTFVGLEREFMSSFPLFWSVPDADARKQLSGRSAFFGEIEHTLLVAEDGGRPVARCAPLINRAWHSSHEGEESTGFIGYYAARPDAADANSELLRRAEAWLAERGMRRVIAPFNGSGMLGMGVLTNAFEESPMFPMVWNPPYYRDYLEAAGYAPSHPFWIFEIDFGAERYREVSQQVLSSPQCEIRPIDKRRWKHEIETLRELFNAGMTGEWEMHRFTAAQFKELFGPMRMSIDPRQIQFAFDDGRPIGFVIGMTDLVPLFRSFAGKLGPLQIARLIRSGRRRTRAGAIGGALLPEYRGRHIGTMAARYFRDLEQMGFERAFYYPVNDANAASRGLAEAIGADGRVVYHCFDKLLDQA